MVSCPPGLACVPWPGPRFEEHQKQLLPLPRGRCLAYASPFKPPLTATATAGCPAAAAFPSGGVCPLQARMMCWMRPA